MKQSIIAIFLFCSLGQAYAQGCSDAGFCTAGAMQGGRAADSSKEKSSFGASFTLGAGEHGTAIYVPQLEAKFAIGHRGSLEAKLPYNIAQGNLGSHSGIGDIIATYSNTLIKNSGPLGLTATAGARIGTGKANATDKGAPLPMPYQSNLGTTDLIAGLSLNYTKYFSLAAGYQQPVIQYNENGYLPVTIYPAMPTGKEYFASAKLVRKGDILLRAEGRLQWKKIMLAAGPLFIYHLGQDGFTNEHGQKELLKGSEGATLNLAGSLSYSLKKARIDLLAGTPFIVRDYRPDGLTRAWVITMRFTQFR